MGGVKFPLEGIHFHMMEGADEWATELLEAATRDVRELLAGRPRTDTFKPDTDPLQILLDAARQKARTELILELDAEAKKP